MNPRFANWSKYVYDLPLVTPICLPGVEIRNRERSIQANRDEVQSEHVSKIKAEDLLQNGDLEKAKSEKYRPLSPPPAVQPNIFKPLPQDMCGNPTAFFVNQNIKTWEKKQLLEVSTHCAMFSLIC